MAIKENKDNNGTHVETSCDDALPPLKKYSISNKSLWIICGLLSAVIVLLFDIKYVLTWISVDAVFKMCEILANYYLILVGGLMALVTMRVIKRTSLKCMKRWELLWLVLFFSTTFIVSLVGAFCDGELWRHTQFVGYALSAYFVSCWLGTDDRKPTGKQSNTIKIESDQENGDTK